MVSTEQDYANMHAVEIINDRIQSVELQEVLEYVEDEHVAELTWETVTATSLTANTGSIEVDHHRKPPKLPTPPSDEYTDLVLDIMKALVYGDDSVRLDSIRWIPPDARANILDRIWSGAINFDGNNVVTITLSEG